MQLWLFMIGPAIDLIAVSKIDIKKFEENNCLSCVYFCGMLTFSV